MSDLISRQAAIDAVQQHREDVLGGYEYDEGVAFVYAAAHNHIIDVIKQLPSAQPEIIRCKDCKHHRKDSHGLYYCCRKEYGYGWGLNDFCSDAERREE